MVSAVRKRLLIPVETLNREFDGKLLLALAAVERGWSPIIGAMTPVQERLPFLPRSLYFAKSARSQNRSLFEVLYRMGHGVVALDEEALVRQSDEIFVMKHESEALNFVSILFAWGGDNAAVWQRSPGYSGAPILPNGNPRVDMMRPELRSYHQPEIDAIRDRFGEFVLLNTNFAVVNHFIPGKTRFKLAEWVPDEDMQRLKIGITQHKRVLFDSFRALVPRIAEAIGTNTLVIRPHPSENHVPWIESAMGLRNVRVVHEGNVVPWLAAARVLLHNGCTSAVEAAAIGTTVLSYRPTIATDFDPPLPNELSIECYDDEQLLAQLRKVLRDGAVPLNDQQSRLLRHHVAAIDGPLSCDRIVESLDQHLSTMKIKTSVSLGDWVGAFVQHERRWLPRRLRRILRKSDKRTNYVQHKFPRLPGTYVNARIARLQRALGRFSGCRAREISRDIYAIGRD